MNSETARAPARAVFFCAPKVDALGLAKMPDRIRRKDVARSQFVGRSQFFWKLRQARSGKLFRITQRLVFIIGDVRPLDLIRIGNLAIRRRS